jgi:hypothetical protein
MPNFATLLMSLCIPSMLVCASEEPKFTPQQEAVIRVHQKMWEAIGKRDLDKWSTYVEEDCIFSGEDGEITTKAELIGHLRTMPPQYDRSENHREFLVRVRGNTAVLNFRLTAHEQFTDTDIITEMRQTETFFRQGGSWKLIAVQWGALPVNFRAPDVDRPGPVDDYAGQYEWRPGGPVDNVSVKNGKLWSRLSEEQHVHEYLPSGEDTFFLRDDLGQITFIRDAQDQVVGYTYRRSDGQGIRVRKIN